MLQKVAPRGWTKEINPITRTPVYTNSRTGERWALGSDAKGNHYYYNMINSSITVGELPDVNDVSGRVWFGWRGVVWMPRATITAPLPDVSGRV